MERLLPPNQYKAILSLPSSFSLPKKKAKQFLSNAQSLISVTDTDRYRLEFVDNKAGGLNKNRESYYGY